MRRRQNLLVASLGGILLTCCGCPVVDNRPAPGQRLTLRDPELQREYHLYVPTTYTHQRRWPLVVTCHGTHPFDNAPMQIDEWKGLAEQRGFLVVAPELYGASAYQVDSAAQISRQIEDERAILAIVKDVSAARTVDETRVFLTGWSAGGYTVFFTGLRHPDVFRAIAIRQGNFNEKFVEPCVPFLDRYQGILLMHGNLDPLKADAERAQEWLEKHDLQPTRLEKAGAHRRDPDSVYGFMVETVRNRPWIRVLIEDDPADAMKMTFSIRASFEPSRYLWDFGDGQRSPVASPTHRYEQPGTYTVKVALNGPGKEPFVRQIQIQAPRIRLGATAIPPPPR